MHGAALPAVPRLVGMDAVEPDAERILVVRIQIGQRRGDPAAIPFLAVHGTSVTADADVEIDHKTETLAASVVGQ